AGGNQVFRGSPRMHCRQRSNQSCERTGVSRLSGDIFIVPESLNGSCAIETRYISSRFDRKKIIGGVRFYKYFAPTALAILIATGAILPSSAQAQRRAAQASASSLPSPRSAFGFDPGDDRKIIDWKQITDYFVRLSKASDRVQVQTI